MAKRKQLFEVDANNNISNTSINRANKKNTLFEVSAKGKVTSHDTSKEKNKNGFFQSSKYFDNGYDFGDISKTAFWSGADLLTDFTRGFSRGIEGKIDSGTLLLADMFDFFGADETAGGIRDVAKYDFTGKTFKQSKNMESKSVFGNYLDAAFEGGGNVVERIVTNPFTGGANINTFISTYGNATTEALRNGEDLSTARKAGLIHASAETISENFFDGLPGIKTKNWGGKVVGKIGSAVERYFGSKTGKVAMKILNASGEGFEEIISNMLTSAGNDLMHHFDKNYTYGMENQTGNILEDVKRAATSKESWEAFISASLTSALTNGANTLISVNQKNNLIKTYAQENNMSVKQVKDMFNQSVQQKTQTEMQRQPNMNLGQRVETENMAKAKTMQELRRGTFVQPGTETQAYQYAKSENQKVNEMNQSIVDAGGNNTQANREAAATAKRLIEDLGFNIKFTNNQQLQEQGQNVNGRNINGFVKDGTMYLNLDSDELANFTIGHETKHFFEANEELNAALNQSLKEYAQEKGIWDKRLAETTELYTDKDGNLIGDPEGELLADLSGQFFTDYNFVSNLSTKNPSLFQKTKDFFQKLYYKATGQQEKLLIKQINDNFNKVYREYAKTQPKQDGTKYSLSENEKNDLLNKNSELYKSIVEKKDIVRSTNELLDLLNNGVTQEQGTSLQILNKGKRPAEYGQQYIEFKPEILLHTDKIFNGDGATNRQQFVKESNKIFNNLQEILNNNPFIYDEILLEGNKPITEYIKSVTIPENSSQELINKLNELGIEINYYKPGLSYNETKEVNNKYSLSEDNQGRELSEQQQEFFKDSKVRDNEGRLLEVYHGTPNAGFTIFDTNKSGQNTSSGEYGLYFTDSKEFADEFSYERLETDSMFFDQKGKKGEVYPVYLNATNVLDFANLTEQEINDLYNYASNLGQLDGKEKFVENMLKWQQIGNHQLMKGNLDLKAIADNSNYDGIKAKLNVQGNENEYIVFNSNQIKNVDNTNPTEDSDIRYSISREGQDISEELNEFYNPKNKIKTRLSDLKRKETELPIEKEKPLKTSENEQKQGEKPTRREVIDRNRQLAREQLGDITQIKDKKRGLLYQINTMKRNLRDIMTKEQAQKMYDTYFKDITTNNAKIENDITSYNERIQKYNLNDKESTYTQMIGELKHNPETTLTKQQVDDFYYKNANKIDQQKCENAVNEFRQIYDELIEKVNDVLTDNGYKPIEYRKGYFPHFIEEKATSKLGKLAEKLGWKVKKGQLPTDIAGITDQFKPGKAWTSFSQQRTGDATDYNALKGLDNYLRGAMDVIHHTNDIQKLRALENEIRYQYSSKGVQDKINEIYADENLDMEEKNDAIANLTSNIRESGLGNFVTEIRNYTDNLANKKSFGDRSMEQTLGRDVYSIMNNINGRVSANMVGANISSAITNFIPITQAWSQLSTKNLMRGMYESIKTSIKGDNFADRSTFLTNRTKQAERLYNTKMDKLTQKLGVPFEAIDSFTSNTIVRAKYYDNIAKGMSEQEAMSNADEFAKDVMAGRSKGDQPTIFNRKNPLFKLFTAFQLEVNNQYGYMFKDIPTNMADEAKRKLVGAFIKMFLGAWLYNEITEKFTGRRAAFDPIDMAVSDVKTLTNEDMDLGDKIQSIVKDTAQEVPFVSGLAGGGRLPIQGAIPYSNPLEMVTKTFEDIGNLDDPKKRKTAINNLKKEWSKPVYYLAFPVAGGQIKKTVEGLSMYDKDLPIAGSYTNSGKLRFEADTSTLGKVQAAVFGQYASKNAREYFKNGYTPLTEGQVEEALEAKLPINEYRKINQGIKDAKAEAKAKGENQTEAMYDYIYDLPIEAEQKNSLINSRTKGSSTIKDDNGYIKYVDDKGKTYWYDKKNDIVYNNKYKEMDTKDIADLTKASTQKDISNYGEYGSLEEFNYSNKNPEKYLALTKIADYDTFMEYKDELAAIKQKYDNKPTEFKKKKVFEYINSLPLSIEQKLMLQKMGAGYSIKQYRGRLHNYINNMELTKEQKQAIDKVLFRQEEEK